MTQTYLLCLIVIACALLVRLSFIRHGGYGFDVWLNSSWGYGGAQFGLTSAYKLQLNGAFAPNYPPLTVALYTVAARIFQTFYDPDFTVDAAPYRALLKMLSIAAEMGIVTMLFWSVRRVRGDWWGFLVGLAYALHPVAIDDSAIWGQSDALYTCAIVAALAAAGRGYWVASGALAAISLCLKMQAVVIFPVFFFLALADVRRMSYLLGGAALATLVVLLPFVIQGNIRDVLNIYSDSVGTYPSLAQGAYNFWYALYGNNPGREDTALFLGIVSYRMVGILLVGAVSLYAIAPWSRQLLDGKRHPPVLLILLLTGIVAQAFYVFATEMHERYIFPVAALTSPLLLTGRRGIMLYWSSGILGILNILSMMPVSAIDRWLFAEFTNLPSFIATGHILVLFLTIQHIHSNTEKGETISDVWTWFTSSVRRAAAEPDS
jgi:Gpi18-like mannosyltransferase